jgi:hypothetical protein
VVKPFSTEESLLLCYILEFSVTIYKFSLLIFTPFPVSPKGEKLVSPSPLGEGWEGGLNFKKQIKFRL